MMPLSKNTLWLFLISCGGDFIPVVACLVGETQEASHLGQFVQNQSESSDASGDTNVHRLSLVPDVVGDPLVDSLLHNLPGRRCH